MRVGPKTIDNAARTEIRYCPFRRFAQGGFMKHSNETVSAVAQAILQARSAMESGRLNGYQPLAHSQAEGERATPSSSWGPAHKK